MNKFRTNHTEACVNYNVIHNNITGNQQYLNYRKKFSPNKKKNQTFSVSKADNYAYDL